MEILSFIIFFIFSFVLFILYNNHNFQIFLHKRKLRKSFLNEFLMNVRGIYYKDAYFSVSHRLLTVGDYQTLSNSFKSHYSHCYNAVTFRTADANWELFFYLVKEGLKFNEIMTIRAFPKEVKIKSEANVEKNYSRLSILANNRYLTGILENQNTREYLDKLLGHNGDIVYISHNNLHHKISVGRSSLKVSRVMEMIKAINYIKNKIYRKDILGY